MGAIRSICFELAERQAQEPRSMAEEIDQRSIEIEGLEAWIFFSLANGQVVNDEIMGEAYTSAAANLRAARVALHSAYKDIRRAANRPLVRALENSMEFPL